MKKTKEITSLILSSVLVSGLAFFPSEVTGASYSLYSDYDADRVGMRGDVNNDDVLSSADMMIFQEHFLGINPYASDKYAYDVNSDGQKNILDVISLKSALLGETKIWSYQNLPVMDGSTSAIPLEAGIKSRLLGVPYLCAKKSVKHHKTHESFQMLLSGENDMIFTVPISESQQKAADDAGVHLNFIPVAKEGFVFVVNKDNPVDSLTQQQIKDIYSGRITNWSEVGGNDEEIIPYQRNNDSGSQNYMVEFMKDSELSDPPLEYRVGSMGGLMDAVAVYENSTQAIGYSVYSYAAQMYENSSDVKFIAVDGVKPSRITMADDSYPLLSNTFIVYTDNASEATREFTDWVISDEGQQCVLENGYIPVKKMDYPEKYKAYRAKGTGKKKPDDYAPYRKYSYFSDYVTRDVYEYRLNCLKDKNLEDMINSDIAAAVSEIRDAEYIRVEAVNGYMSVEIYKKGVIYDTEDYFFSAPSVRNVITLNYDLVNGRKIEKFSDLFYKDIDFTETVNDKITYEMTGLYSFLSKGDFLGLTGNVDNFTVKRIYTGKDNLYISDNFDIVYDSYYLPDLMVTGEYFDMHEIMSSNAEISNVYYNSWNYEPVVEDGILYYGIEGSRFHTAEEVGKRKSAYARVFSWMKNEADKTGGEYNHIYIYEPGENSDEWGKIYDELNVLTANCGNNLNFSSLDINAMFDTETGEHVTMSDIFGKSAELYANKDFDINNLNGELRMLIVESGSVKVQLPDGSEDILEFNPDEVNMKYINHYSSLI